MMSIGANTKEVIVDKNFLNNTTTERVFQLLKSDDFTVLGLPRHKQVLPKLYISETKPLKPTPVRKYGLKMLPIKR